MANISPKKQMAEFRITEVGRVRVLQRGELS